MNSKEEISNLNNYIVDLSKCFKRRRYLKEKYKMILFPYIY